MTIFNFLGPKAQKIDCVSCDVCLRTETIVDKIKSDLVLVHLQEVLAVQ